MVKLSWKIWLLIAVLIACLLILKPSFEKGVEIVSVEDNSTVQEAGLKTGDIIKSIDNNFVNNFNDYSKIINELFPENLTEAKKITITTKKDSFIIFTN